MPPKLINMRDPKKIDKPIKTVRNPQTKLLRQATPEEIAGAIAKINDDKKKAKKAEAKKAAEAEKVEAKKEEDKKAEASAAEDKKADAIAAEDKKADAIAAEDKKADASAADQKTEEANKASEADKTAIEQNFYWIKHAESVANLYNNEETDKYKEAAAQKELDTEKVEFRKKDYEKVELTLTGGAVPPPILKKPGEEQIERTAGVFPLMNEIKNLIGKLATKDKKKEIMEYVNDEESCKSDKETYNYKKCSTMIANKYKKKEEVQLAYIVSLKSVSFYSFFQPTLSQGGMVQARILGEQLKQKDLKPDTILCAATVPAMMTAYLTALYAELPDTMIYIVPYINEKESEEAKKAFEGSTFHDFANYGISPVVIAEVGTKIAEWFKTAQIYDKEDAAAAILSSDTPPRFDYTYYQGGDEVRDSAATTTFFEWLDKTPLKEKPNVWVFSYDTPIQEIRKQALAGAIEDTIPLWNTNTAVFQHKRQGTALQAIFPKDAPPKLTIPFPEELAAGGLIYYPNAGTQDTMIRAKKTALMAMDKTEKNDPLTSLDPPGLRGQIAAITHGENLADINSVDKYIKGLEFKLKILAEKLTKIPQYKNPTPPKELTTQVEQDEFIRKYKEEYKNEKTNIDEMLKYFQKKKTEVQTDKKIDPLLDEMVKDVEEQLMNVIKKYTAATNPPDKKGEIKQKIIDKLTEETTVKLKELNVMVQYYLGRQLSAAESKLQTTLLGDIANFERKIKEVEQDKVSETVLNDYKRIYRISGGGGGSRKKRSKKAKKSIRKNRKQIQHKSKKNKKHVKKYTKRTTSTFQKSAAKPTFKKG